jgi:hypothetical protein
MYGTASGEQGEHTAVVEPLNPKLPPPPARLYFPQRLYHLTLPTMPLSGNQLFQWPGLWGTFLIKKSSVQVGDKTLRNLSGASRRKHRN